MKKLKYIISDKDSVVYLNVDEISCSYQRKCSNEDITVLASSIKENGVIVPVIVRQNGERYDLDCRLASFESGEIGWNNIYPGYCSRFQ